MSQPRNQRFKRLGVIGAIILGAVLIGYLAGELQLVLDVLRAIALVLVGITILVTIHELGHFLTAKAFGMRVETFSIGFPPKLFSFKRGETEYQVGVTPLGGYVKISGIIDESLDAATIQQEKERERLSKEDLDYYRNHPDEAPDWLPKPWEFRSKPVWQRLIVMTGGVIMNVILGILIFTTMAYIYGEQRIPMSEIKYGIEIPASANTLGHIIGFETGDTLVSFKGEAFEFFGEYQDEQILLEDDAYFEVQRKGEIVTLKVPEDIQNYFNRDSIEPLLFLPNIPAVAGIDTSKQSQSLPAYQSGMRDQDQIIQLDSTPIRFFSDLRAFMKDKANKTIQVTALRGSDTLHFEAHIGEDPMLGVRPNYEVVFHIDTVEYTFWEAITPGAKRAFGFVSANVQGIKNLTRSNVSASESVMGPVQIAKLYLTAFNAGGVEAFLRLTGMLSMILAFVNILPIPALDGGHVVFLLIEGITRREPSTRVRVIAQQIGMLIILGLMVLIIFNDFFRVIFG